MGSNVTVHVTVGLFDRFPAAALRRKPLQNAEKTGFEPVKQCYLLTGLQRLGSNVTVHVTVGLLDALPGRGKSTKPL